MIQRAAAALPYDDREQATAGLRGQLRPMAVAAGATPDWTTLVVEGPTEAVGLHGRVWFEWTATVVSDGGQEINDDAVDAAILSARPAAQDPATDETAPRPHAM